MVMDTLGLAICVGLTFSVRRHPQLRLLLPLLTFPFLVVLDLLCIYQELKATHLRTLNRERAEILAERWLLDGLIFTAKEVDFELQESRFQLTASQAAFLGSAHLTDLTNGADLQHVKLALFSNKTAHVHGMTHTADCCDTSQCGFSEALNKRLLRIM